MFSSIASLYRNAYSGLSRRVWLLAVVMLINRSGTMVLAFMTLYCISLGFSIDQAGLVVGIYGAGAVTGALLGGKISDRFGFYYTQVSALILGGIMFFVVGQMRTYESICLSTFFLSLVNESFRPANASAIAHYSTIENRTQSFSLVRLAINLGWGIGSAVGGLIASFNYHLLFWVDGFTSIFAGIMLLILLPRVKQGPLGNSGRKRIANESPYKDIIFIKFMVFQVVFAACFFQLFTTVPLYFKTGLKLDEFWIGVVMAGNGLMIAVFEMVLVFKLEGKRPYLVLMAYGSLIMAVAFALLTLPLASGLIVAVAFMITITFAEMIGMPFMNTYYISRSTENNRGQYAGIYTMGWSLAQVVGSSGGGWFAQRFGFSSLWWVTAVMCIVAASGYYFLGRRPKLI